jgi:hypothetical protein
MLGAVGRVPSLEPNWTAGRQTTSACDRLLLLCGYMQVLVSSQYYLGLEESNIRAD